MLSFPGLSLLCYLCSAICAIFAMLSLLCYLCYVVFAMRSSLSILVFQAIYAEKQGLSTGASRDKCLVARPTRHAMDSAMVPVHAVPSGHRGHSMPHARCGPETAHCSQGQTPLLLSSCAAAADGNKAGGTSHCVSLQMSACHDKARLLHSIPPLAELSMASLAMIASTFTRH